MHFCSALTAKVLPPQFRCRFTLCISTQFRAVLHEGLALQRDEASLFASQKSKPSNTHLVKFKRFLHVSECNGEYVENLLNGIYSDTDVPCQWLSITITPSVYVVVLTLEFH